MERYRILRTSLFVLFLGAFVLGLAVARQGMEEPVPEGVVAPDAPTQRGPRSRKPWSLDEYTVTSLAEYDIEARVLSVVRYRRGREADLSPLDFVLGWGPMSDDEILDQLRLRHSGRYYSVSAQEPPLPWRKLMETSANVHLIPADDDVARALRQVDEDDVVHLSGKLVKVEGPGGWKWTSSLSRRDSGCELMWVESVERR